MIRSTHPGIETTIHGWHSFSGKELIILDSDDRVALIIGIASYAERCPLNLRIRRCWRTNLHYRPFPGPGALGLSGGPLSA